MQRDNFNDTTTTSSTLPVPIGYNLNDNTLRTLNPGFGNIAFDATSETFEYALNGEWISINNGPSPVNPNPSWFVPDWYVAPITGSDNNNGTSPATAVQTIMGGIVSRWGTQSPILNQNTIIHLLEPETIGQESVVLAPVIVNNTGLVNGVSFAIIGTNINILTTNITSIISTLNPTAGGGGTNLIFTVSNNIGLSAGNLIFNLTRGSYAVIDAIDFGNGHITATQPFDQVGLTTVSSNPILSLDNGWTIGDTLQFEDSPLLNLKVINPKGGDGFNPVCWLQNIFVPSIGGIGISQITPVPEACSFVMSNCRLDVFIILDAKLIYIVGQLQNTWLNGGSLLGRYAIIMGGASNTAGINYYGFFGGQADGNAILHSTPSIPSFLVSPGARFGKVNLSGSFLFINNGATLEIFTSYIGSAIVWGTASLRLTQNNATVANAGLGFSTLTWTSCLNLTGSLTINGLNNAYAFVAGSFIPSINITPANLDTYAGLQNPLTGSCFAGPWLE